MLDFEALIEKNLPSDKRFAKLFPNDIAKWMKYRDLSTEWFIVDEYNCWISDLKSIEGDEGRRDFYEGLWRELDSDADDVWAEREVAFEGVGNLEQWEFENLDQDGGTKGIEGWSENEWVQMCWCLEAWERYGRLAPPGYESTSWPWYKKRGHIDSPPEHAITVEESDSKLKPPEPVSESSDERLSTRSFTRRSSRSTTQSVRNAMLLLKVWKTLHFGNTGGLIRMATLEVYKNGPRRTGTASS